MKRTLVGLMVVILAALGVLLAAPAQAYPGWQAIFYSPNAHYMGYARGYPTRASADIQAFAQCAIVGGSDCSFVAVSTGYVALAVGPYLWAGGTGTTTSEAAYSAIIRSNGGTLIQVIAP